MNKVPVRVTINKDVLEAAREYIPNLSHFFETKLVELLHSINHPITKKNGMDRWGFEPQAFAMPRFGGIW
ncbi:MAG: type II toxin-antitoxin system CcdA family antitoxin [Archaeoglobus sp.]|uniref:type II toxin-antitoxin system CcdA family antitoxin n=1 Tax=Archaeoglobus sp. TaxID=1872626 RepID=UPI001E0D9121|nr:type II toxin-antitoxin system CcdA family antitoxin [Archaeoglobus sp.]MBO8179539.1 type II toxin-antitoxin system CcdA family antitoxin [Archaeoglobus sp.]